MITPVNKPFLLIELHAKWSYPQRLILILISSLLPLMSHSASFEVRGAITCAVFADGIETAQYSNTFTATVSDCYTKIITSTSNPEIEYFEYGTEGKYSYVFDKYIGGELSWMKKAREEKIPQKALKESANNSSLELFPTLVPSPMKAPVIPVWIAYSSRCYFRDAKGGIIDSPFFQPGFIQRGVLLSRTVWPKVPAAWRFSPENPNLIESCVVFFDPSAPDVSPKGTRITNAVYRVDHWANCGSQRIPDRFSVTVYRQDPNYKQNGKLNVAAEYRGIASEFREISRLDGVLPPVTKKTQIADYRFADAIGEGGVINYLAKEGKIRTLEELRSDEQIRRIYFDQKRPLSATNSGYLTGRTVLAMVIGLPLFFFALLLWRRRNKQINKT